MDPLSRLLNLLNPRTYNCGGLDLGGLRQFTSRGMTVSSAMRLFPGRPGFRLMVFPISCISGLVNAFCCRAEGPFALLEGRTVPFAAYSEVEAVQCGTIATYGEGGQSLIVGAHYAFTTMQAVMLLDLLPLIVHLQNSVENVALCWTLQRMSEELLHPQPGGVVVAHSLARMMLVQALRVHIADNARNGSGGLSALSDAQMSRAIACMQKEPALDWTVEKLANRAGMSRAGLRSNSRRLSVNRPSNT